MARYKIDYKVQGEDNVPIAGASVQVNVSGGGATVYAALTGTATLPNPLTTDAYGNLTGVLEAGSYKLVISHPHFRPRTVPYIVGAGATLTALVSIDENGKIKLRSEDGAIVFGLDQDTSLFRDSASVLKTDDKLEVASLRVGASATAGQVLTADVAGNATFQAPPAPTAPVPTGSLFAFAGSAAPVGYLLCDGVLYSTVTHDALFLVVGHAYNGGVDPGAGQFKLPDLRGRVPVGEDGSAGRLSASDARGQSGGGERHTLVTAEMPAHSHAFTAYGIGFGAGGANGGRGRADQNSPANNWPGYALADTGGSGAHNNMQPYQVANWMIKT